MQVASLPNIFLSNADATEALTKLTDGAGLAVIDCLLPAANAKETENDAEFRRHLDVLTRVSERSHCAFLVVHHEGKPGKGRPGIARVRGTSAIIDACAAVLSLSGMEAALTLEMTKSSLGPFEPRVPLRIEGAQDPAPLRVVGDGAAVLDPKASNGARDRTENIVLLNVSGGANTTTSILKAGGARKEDLQATIKNLLADGCLRRSSRTGPFSLTDAGRNRLEASVGGTPSKRKKTR